MAERSDLVVVGGGVIGACVAYEATRRGAAVTLLERHADVAPPESAVHANCGIVCPSDAVPLAHAGALGKGLRWMLDGSSPFYIRPRASLALTRWLVQFLRSCRDEEARRHGAVQRALGVLSGALHAELAGGHGHHYRYRQNGWLWLFESGAAWAAAQAEAAQAAGAGIPCRLLDTEAVRRAAPAVRGTLSGGIHFEEDAHLEPAAFTRTVAGLAAAGGAEVRTGWEAIGFETRGARVTRVLTTRGDVAADQVVLAAGAWTPGLARELGLALLIEPAKGYSIDVPCPQGMPDMPIHLEEVSVAIAPFGDTLRMGSTLELAGWDMAVRRRRLAHIRRAGARLLGVPESAPATQIWRAPRPVTPDGLPYLARSPRHGNVIVAAGHCMLGLSLGPATGRLVAEMAAGEPPSLDLQALRLGRF